MSVGSPRVSVVLPVRDMESTIDAAIDSVLAQEGVDWELIVVDDGSSDGTADRVEAREDPRIRRIQQDHAGPSAARNRGIAAARGEYVAFLDADDVWMPDKLRAQVAALDAAPRAGVAYGWTDLVDPQLGAPCPDRRARHAGDVHRALLSGNFISSGSNTLVRRSALQHCGGFDESLRGAEDWELHTRLARAFPFALVPQVVVLYRLSPSSLSARLEQMAEHFERARRKVFDALPPELAALESECRASFYYYLAVRATQAGWRAGLLRTPRYLLVALAANWRRTLGLLRGASPGAALRLARGGARDAPRKHDAEP